MTSNCGLCGWYRILVARRRNQTTPLFFALLTALLLAALQHTHAEQLPLKSYRSTDGLSQENITHIMRDSRGFLWFCGALGMSRFDGHRFTTYGREQGIFFPVNSLIEARAGVYWLATNGNGAYQFHPYATSQGSRLTAYPVGDNPAANRVNRLYEDRAGRIWAGTDAGLFRLDAGGSKFLLIALGIPTHPDHEVQVWDFVEDREGSLWISSKFGLSRHLPDGRILNYSVDPLLSGRDTVRPLLADREGRIWAGHQSMLVVFKPEPISSATRKRFPWQRLSRCGSTDGAVTMPESAGEACTYGVVAQVFCQTSDGEVWFGSTVDGLVEFNGQRFRSYSKANSLSENSVLALAEDQDRNLWLGLRGSGALKLARSGFVTFTRADGLGHDVIGSVFETQSGEFYAITGNWHINRMDAGRFTSVRLNLPKQFSDSMWRTFRYIIQDSAGEWWVGTTEGLYRFSKIERIEQLAQARPRAVYTARDGLVSDDVTQLFEDSRGDIWISTFAPERESLTRWQRSTGRFHRYSDRDGLRPFNAAISFCEDAAGQVWIGFRERGLARYSAGRFTFFDTTDGLPAGAITDLHLDRAGRLWLGSPTLPENAKTGLIRIDNPLADRPRFITDLHSEGLSGIFPTRITEDAAGRIYFATLQGVKRFDPTTRQIKHYTTADGLASARVHAVFARRGYVWFGTLNGLSRLTAQPEAFKPPPDALINGLRIAGRSQPVSDFGLTEIGKLELEPGHGQIQIDFFSVGESLRYQYKIEGAGQDWSAPTEQRTVDMSLGPGSYRFLVRAVGSDGALSESPASFSFRILPPIWQRWWFIALAGLSMILVTYAVMRSRVKRLVELERVRTRIATDLHDDIGSGLTQVSVLTEVIGRRIGPEPDVSEPLSMIGRLSRDLVDSMNDIVWAINPQRDHLSDLTRRMRRFASDVFTARNLEFNFQAPDEQHDIRMGADMRRDLFLIFKESVNNIVRHSGCSQADIEFRIGHGWLDLKLQDNGKGFDPSRVGDGNGLQNMRQRAGRIGGSLEVISGVGQGTSVRLKAPLGGREK